MMHAKCLGSVFLLLIGICCKASGAFVGVNIGTDVSSFPTPVEVVAMLKAHQISHVRLYDSDSGLLNALSRTGIDVMVGVTNEEILGIGQSPGEAAAWVNKNILPHIPGTNITAIAVGSEVLSTVTSADALLATLLVRAMYNLHTALVASNLNFLVKVSTPHSMVVIPKPFPPSAATFNSTLNSTIYQILHFLKNTNSSFMLNAYPYYGYAQADGIFPIDYALFQPLSSAKQIVDPNTLFHYDSMFDAMVDAAYYSMQALGFSQIPIIVTESGWPSSGGANEPDATTKNAETFNNNLVLRVSNGTGPPSQPTFPMNTYIYELFNEDKRSNPVSEKYWGFLSTNGSAVYPLSLSTSGEEDRGNSSGHFCVAKRNAVDADLQKALSWACGAGGANCAAIQPGGSCYFPNTVTNHASFAYNDYFQRKRATGGTCDFHGTATLTGIDPSNGTCVYAGSRRSNSSMESTSPVAFGPSTDGFSGSSILRGPKFRCLVLAVFIASVFF